MTSLERCGLFAEVARHPLRLVLRFVQVFCYIPLEPQLKQQFLRSELFGQLQLQLQQSNDSLHQELASKQSAIE